MDYQGEDIAIGFNSRYLMDVLTAMDRENVALELSDPLSPCLITEDGERALQVRRHAHEGVGEALNSKYQITNKLQ